MVLVDTSMLIDLIKGNINAWKKVEKLEKQDIPIRIPSPAVFELSAGSPPGLDDKRMKMIDRMHAVPFTEEHAERAGIIFRQLKEKGLEIGPLDTMIAGVAYVEKEPLLTRDKHFSRVEGIRLETYE